MNERSIKISEISEILNLSFIGEDIVIDGLNLCNRISECNSILSYLESKDYISHIAENKSIKALFVTDLIYKELKSMDIEGVLAFFIVKNPEVAFYKLHHLLYNESSFYIKYDFKSQIGSNTHIHQSAIIDDGVIIGDYVCIGANSVIKKGSKIGSDTIIGCCSVIGCEGFQLIYDENRVPFTVIHTGGTSIGQNVFIGDNCTICNALFEGDVIIGNNCKIDSQVHVGHNCTIGNNTVITGNSLLMGSVQLQNNVWISPSSVVSNKCIVYDNVFVGSSSLVVNNIRANTSVCGNPAIPIKDYFKILVEQKKTLRK